MVRELRANCSSIININGIEAFIIHISRESREKSRSLDRVSVQMPGHLVLKNVGFGEGEIPDVFEYINSNMPVLVDMALERTEALEGLA